MEEDDYDWNDWSDLYGDEFYEDFDYYGGEDDEDYGSDADGYDANDGEDYWTSDDSSGEWWSPDESENGGYWDANDTPDQYSEPFDWGGLFGNIGDFLGGFFGGGGGSSGGLSSGGGSGSSSTTWSGNQQQQQQQQSQQQQTINALNQAVAKLLGNQTTPQPSGQLSTQTLVVLGVGAVGLGVTAALLMRSLSRN